MNSSTVIKKGDREVDANALEGSMGFGCTVESVRNVRTKKACAVLWE